MFVHKTEDKIDGFARRGIPVESDSGEDCEGWEELQEADKEELDAFLA